MMAALMATTALVARGASNEEVRHEQFLFWESWTMSNILAVKGGGEDLGELILTLVMKDFSGVFNLLIKF